jgi:glucose-1-phosphate adenylyltransferase
MPSLNEVLAVVLGGGQGRRLSPLTVERAKPAVPIAGKYRLIDIPISNCINSGINRVAVLTQFNSVSLHRHIARTYVFDAFHGGWVQIWAAEQTPGSTDWYQGTADAVRKQLLEIRTTGAKYVLVLAGDHLYRMDYASMTEFHWEHQADITVAVQPVSTENAARFGLCKRLPDCRIASFVEKPTDPAVLADFVSRDDPKKPYLGSMGIYLFNADVLVDIMARTKFDDFGGEVIPQAIRTHNVCGYDFEGYWEDIGTIRSFYETNLMLTDPDPAFRLHDPENPVYTRMRFLPPSSIDSSTLENVFLADGCNIQGAKIQNSVIGLRSQVSPGAQIVDTYLMGADFYETPASLPPGVLPIGVGSNCYIEGAIIDKNVRLGAEVVIRPFPQGTELDAELYVVRDGIVVVTKNKQVPQGTYIGPER